MPNKDTFDRNYNAIQARLLFKLTNTCLKRIFFVMINSFMLHPSAIARKDSTTFPPAGVGL